jgi:hypothetical protein
MQGTTLYVLVFLKKMSIDIRWRRFFLMTCYILIGQQVSLVFFRFFLLLCWFVGLFFCVCVCVCVCVVGTFVFYPFSVRVRVFSKSLRNFSESLGKCQSSKTVCQNSNPRLRFVAAFLFASTFLIFFCEAWRKDCS